jgi:hypothetical protein
MVSDGGEDERWLLGSDMIGREVRKGQLRAEEKVQMYVYGLSQDLSRDRTLER